MSGQNLLSTIAALLAAGVVSVPIAKRLGLGSVLGYLVAGAVIGPFCLKLLTNSDDILHVAEFGVVMLLFLVGLELEPKRLWSMRKSIFGLGSLQVLSCAAVIALVTAIVMGWNSSAAIVAGLGFAMSSTAIVLQILAERGIAQTGIGKDSFSVLLFQDLAVIPILAILPLLGTEQSGSGAGQASMSPLMRSLAAIGIIVGLFVFSRVLVRPLFHWIAKTRQKEIFTALSLFIVVGIALVMDSIGLSMALGTFLAGVVLADCEYRHELQSNVEPFKGLLLGIFFTAVGSSMNFSILAEKPTQILMTVVVLLASKIILLKLCAKLFGHESRGAWFFSILLSQGGEFAFVLFSTARNLGALTIDQASELTLVVALSMFSTPFLLKATEKLLVKKSPEKTKEADKIESDHDPVIVAGMGRFGQIIVRFIHSQGIRATIVDHSPDLLDRVRPFGFKVYYGDATDMNLLESAGIEHAKALVLAIDDRDGCTRIAEQVRKHYPHIRILARAFDMLHMYELMDLGVQDIERETFNAALSLGERVLLSLGVHSFQARKLSKYFHRYDLGIVEKMHKIHKDRPVFASSMKAAREEIESLFANDEKNLQEGSADSAWIQK
ncbi:MAG: monovalent cation:proton antiporter-2 (CPA2) family protein [Silvanigrellaceae bacterium]